MPISSQLTPSISTQPLQNYQALHSISKAEPRQPSEESNFYCLYLQSNSFRQFPQLMDIGVGRNIDRSVNRHLCFPSLFTTTDHSSTTINLSVPSVLDKTNFTLTPPLGQQLISYIGYTLHLFSIQLQSPGSTLYCKERSYSNRKKPQQSHRGEPQPQTLLLLHYPL